MSNSAQGTVEYLVILAVVIVLALIVVGLVVTQMDKTQQVSTSSNTLGLSTQVIGITESLVNPNDGNFVVKLLNNSGEFITISNVKVGDTSVNFSEDLAQGGSKLFKVSTSDVCDLGKVISEEVIVTYVNVNGLTKAERYPAKVMFDCTPYTIVQANLANQCPSVPTFDGTADVNKVLFGYSFFSNSSTKQTGQLFLLPKTGQTTSFENGDDGTYQSGNKTTPRFIDNDDGTISDMATGLMWVKQPELIIPGAPGVALHNQIQFSQGDWLVDTDYTAGDLIIDTSGGLFYVCAVSHHSGLVDFATDQAAHPTYWRETIWVNSSIYDEIGTQKAVDWSTAIENCNNLEYAGYSDWRLPNKNELESIYDYSEGEMYSIFPGAGRLSYCWTSTVFTPTPSYVYIVTNGTAETLISSKSEIDTSSYIVRGGIQ